MLPSCFDNIFVHSRQKARLRPELSPKFLSTLGPNPTRKAQSNLQLWFKKPFKKRKQMNSSDDLLSEAVKSPKEPIPEDLDVFGKYEAAELR